MIESDPHQAAVGTSHFSEPDKLRGAPSRRLFDEDVLSSRHRAVRYFRERVVQCRDDDNGDGRLAARYPPVRPRLAILRRGCQPFGAVPVNIRTDHETRAAERLRSLLADMSATNN